VKYTLKTMTAPTRMCNGIQRKDGCHMCAIRQDKHETNDNANKRVGPQRSTKYVANDNSWESAVSIDY